MGQAHEDPSEQLLRSQLEETSASVPAARTAPRQKEEIQNWPQGHLCSLDNSLWARWNHRAQLRLRDGSQYSHWLYALDHREAGGGAWIHQYRRENSLQAHWEECLQPRFLWLRRLKAKPAKFFGSYWGRRDKSSCQSEEILARRQLRLYWVNECVTTWREKERLTRAVQIRWKA